MVKRLYIIGAGGFGREVLWLVERINDNKKEWDVEGFLDDDEGLCGSTVNNVEVVGKIDFLRSVSSDVWVVCAIGSSKVKAEIIHRISFNPHVKFATLIDPSVIMSSSISVGCGSIICAGCILTVDIDIGKHVILNLDCTVGHDSVIGDYVTVYPSSNISGTVVIEDFAEIGTGTQIKQGVRISRETIVGAGAVVIKDTASKSQKIAVIGASGHGEVVGSIAELVGYKEIVYLDDNKDMLKCGKFPVVGDSSKQLDDSYDYFVAIGNSDIRERITHKLNQRRIVSLIHPKSIIADDVTIGNGVVIMAGTVINSNVIIGDGAIINTSSSVDHDCIIGNYTHLAVGCHVAGAVEIGDKTWIGVGASISNNLKICDNCIIGAGAVVVNDIKQAGTYVGVPSKLIK